MNSNRRTLRVGLIGCGKVAEEHHLPSLQLVSNVKVVALADQNEEKLDHLSRKYNIRRRYNNSNDLLADPEIDAIGVLTPTSSHCEIGVAALNAGRHVFLEKPLALSRIECDRLVEASRDTGKTKMICFNLRWHRLIVEAKRLVTSGVLGEIQVIRSIYTHYREGIGAPDWHRKLHLGGGVTFNESIHHFDLWRFVLDREVVEVHAFHNPSKQYEDETSVVGARLSGGVLGTIVNTFKTSPTSEIEILGSKGRLCINLYQFDGLRFYPYTIYPGSLNYRLKGLFKSIGQLAGFVPTMRRGGSFNETFVHAWDHFVDSALADRPATCTFEDGRRAVLITLAAVSSFQSERAVLVSGNNKLPCN